MLLISLLELFLTYLSHLCLSLANIVLLYPYIQHRVSLECDYRSATVRVSCDRVSARAGVAERSQAGNLNYLTARLGLTGASIDPLGQSCSGWGLHHVIRFVTIVYNTWSGGWFNHSD